MLLQESRATTKSVLLCLSSFYHWSNISSPWWKPVFTFCPCPATLLLVVCGRLREAGKVRAPRLRLTTACCDRSLWDSRIYGLWPQEHHPQVLWLQSNRDQELRLKTQWDDVTLCSRWHLTCDSWLQFSSDWPVCLQKRCFWLEENVLTSVCSVRDRDDRSVRDRDDRSLMGLW